MTEFIKWIAHHPDVDVSFNTNLILNSVCVKMRQGISVIIYAFDHLECSWLVEDEDHFITVLNDLYDKLNNEKEEK